MMMILSINSFVQTGCPADLRYSGATGPSSGYGTAWEWSTLNGTGPAHARSRGTR